MLDATQLHREVYDMLHKTNIFILSEICYLSTAIRLLKNECLQIAIYRYHVRFRCL